jgi:hypothetical protein
MGAPTHTGYLLVQGTKKQLQTDIDISLLEFPMNHSDLDI